MPDRRQKNRGFMSLSKKTIVLFLVLGISFCLGSFVVLKLAIFPAFEDFERKSSEEALMRVTRALDADLRALEIMNVEYSLWDQTYAYAKGQKPEYAEENLDPGYWHSVNIHLMMIFDAAGNELYARFGDPSDGTELAIQDQLSFALRPDHPLIAHENVDDSLKGLIYTRSGVMQIVSYPILTSQAEGPIAGSLVVGQLLTPKRVLELGERATTGLSIYPIDEARALPREVALVREKMNFGELKRVETDDDTVRGYQILYDLFEQPVAIVEVSASRGISEIGTKSIRTTMIALAAASAIFLLAALLFLHRLITEPVAKLTRQILKIRESGNLTIDVSDARADELGVLAHEFGQLTRKLGDVQVDLEAARDEALAMSRAKSDFLARMSHEIRTPMNGVLGMTELLRDTPLDDKQQRFARTIYESGESLLHIINDILDISKIESGKIELDMAPFNLQNLVEECLDLLAESAHSKGLELVCAIPSDVDVHVRGDSVRLRQVLMNLIGNAIKFTEQGQIIVRLTLVRESAGTLHYRFEIDDTGIGISPENSEAIFEPFTQEDGSYTRRYGGTGLGLSISKQLVELMGGEIGVEANPGGGCTFWFTTSLEADSAIEAHPEVNPLVGKSALIVDDNRTNLEVLRHQLEGWQMQVKVACSGPDALDVLSDAVKSQTPFDIMLLDMAMPGMDGLELARAVRKVPAFRHTPLLMLSSISRANVVHEQSMFDPDDWLAKPVRKARLHDSLLSLLSKTADRDADQGGQKSEDSDPGMPESGLRVLLVDDNDVNLAVAREMLNTMGHQIASATDGHAALEHYKTGIFDVVLMDCRMPGMDGFEATQRIRQWEDQQGRCPTPIIALTAHAQQGDRERCIEAGMTDYLSKPFTKQQLSSILSANEKIGPSTIEDSQDSVVQMPLAAANESLPEPTKRILIVEDNQVNQQVARAMLESLGYESETAEDGKQALDALSRSRFDLILMDCHMAVCSGYEATKEIRLRESNAPQSTRIPIVALTADFLESNRQKCLDSGMDDYLTKPFTQEQLRVVLNRWLSPETPGESAPAREPDGFSKLGDTIALASIDQQALNEIRELDSSSGALVLREIIVSYCASSSQLMLKLRSAVAERDTALIEQLAHSLKGGSSQLGATFFASLCSEIIASATGEDLENLDAKFEQAAVEHCAVLAGLDKALQNMAA